MYPDPLVAENITLDNYSLLTPAAPSGVPTYVQEATVAGIASVSVQPDGETVYAETVVASLLAIVNGTSTMTTLVARLQPKFVRNTRPPPLLLCNCHKRCADRRF